MTNERRKNILKRLLRLYTDKMPKLMLLPKGTRTPIPFDGIIESSGKVLILKDSDGVVVGQISGQSQWWAVPPEPKPVVLADISKLSEAKLELIGRALESNLTDAQAEAIKEILNTRSP